MSKEFDDLENELRRAWGLSNEEFVSPAARAAEEQLSKPASECHEGALVQGAKQAEIPLDESRRKFLTLGLRIPLGEAIASVLKNPITATVASLIGAGEVGYQIIHEHSDDELARYGIRRQFVERVTSMSYLEPTEIKDIDLNRGEGAILDSIRSYRLGAIQELATAQPELRLAAQTTEDPHGQALAQWRLMVDSSFLGEGKDAETWLQVLRLRGVGLDLQLKLLDGATATALNLMSPQEFARLQSHNYDHVAEMWGQVGWDLSDAKSIAAHYERGSVGTLTTALQHVNVLAVRRAISSGEVIAVRGAQEAWFDSLRELNHRLEKKPMANEIAFDFLQSLTRVAFHASATGHQDLVCSILDYYFGRKTGPSNSGTVAFARETIAKNWGGNSPWMLLLDLVNHDRSWSKDRLHRVLRHPGVQLRAGSPQLANAFVRAARWLGISDAELTQRFETSVAKTQVPKVMLVRYYLNQLHL